MWRFVAIAIGALLGAVAGWFIGLEIATNVFGTSYEATVTEILSDEPAAGWIMLTLIGVGAVAGGIAAIRLRGRGRDTTD